MRKSTANMMGTCAERALIDGNLEDMGRSLPDSIYCT